MEKLPSHPVMSVIKAGPCLDESPTKDNLLHFFLKISFYLLIICALSYSRLLWHLLEKHCALRSMYTAFWKCAIHSTLQWFFFFFPPLLGTEVNTPVDSSPYLIGSVALNQPVMELMAVCHPWRYKFPGGVSCRQCMKYPLCASKDW